VDVVRGRESLIGSVACCGPSYNEYAQVKAIVGRSTPCRRPILHEQTKAEVSD
jgi:hypothetical protein